MKTSQILLLAGGAFLVYEFVLKPKTTTPVVPGYTPQPAANPITSLLNLITGKPATTATTTQSAQQLATALGNYSTSPANTAASNTAASNTAAAAASQIVAPDMNPNSTVIYYTDSAGNGYNAYGNLIAPVTAATTAYTTASGGSNADAIDPSTGQTYSTDFYNGD